MAQVALFIGSFQPWHLGHEDALKQVLVEKRVDAATVIVAIENSTTRDTRKNPFSGEERKAMILATADLPATVKVVMLPDTRDPAGFANTVAEACASQTGVTVELTNTTVITSSPYTADCFKGWATFSPERRLPIQSGLLRSLMCPPPGTAADAWKSSVCAKVARIVERGDGIARITKTMMRRYRNPSPTADMIVEVDGGKKVLLIRRKNHPVGWALPGGFVDDGEDVWEAGRREVKEETSLDVKEAWLMNVYGRPDRDPRFHALTTVFIATKVEGVLQAADDACDVKPFSESEIPWSEVVFDHSSVLRTYFEIRKLPSLPLYFSKTW